MPHHTATSCPAANGSVGRRRADPSRRRGETRPCRWIGSAAVGTIVSFHAHPDDESIGTAGTLARAADAGHRVVLVFATRGELGEPVPGVLADGEQLALRRSAECYTAAQALGRAPRRVPRLHRLRDDGRAHQRRPVLLLARPGRARGPAAGGDPGRGGARRPHRLRRHRRLRPSRPHPGAPGGDARRGAERGAGGGPADDQPRLAGARAPRAGGGRTGRRRDADARAGRGGLGQAGGARSRTRWRSSTSPTASGRRCGRTPARWGPTTRCSRCPSRCSSSGWGWSSTSCAPRPSPAAAPDVFHELFTPLR